ncbi:hypothetical protein [Halomonas binhaiensis]|uniref:Uncharacterized protein n=1 Tax=Halomonas binhaiensis TaxID=2562282 RepID=A0A5C1NDM7_9GAMM|nr:hypothetical protein [Halomonas binhaiensis]QEM80335.1 hypothetical protein E4T21_01250 [Halomonas binhaiensis]
MFPFAPGEWVRGAGAVLLLVLLLNGCASVADWRTTSSAAEISQPSARDMSCLNTLAVFDETVAAAGVADAGYARIAGFPYLRSDRLLASFNHQLHDDPSDPRYSDWLTRMRALDAEARRIEAANLPPAQRQRLGQELVTRNPVATANACADTLLAEELLGAEDHVARAALQEAVEVPDSYLTAWRVMGLYPLTSLGLAAGYEGWKRGYLDAFRQDVQGLPAAALSSDAMTYYVPAVVGDSLDAADEWLRSAPRSPLGLLDIDDQALLRLAAYHAPVFSVGVRNHDDALGAPYWRQGPKGPLPAVDTNHPMADVRLAHTRYQGQILPQLVYTVWFPARTRSDAMDILGGRLDGLVWRVTLGPNGRPLIYDSMHPCGCYHLFFPVPPLQRVEVAADNDPREAPLTPISAPPLEDGQRMGLRLAPTSHFLEGLAVSESIPSGAIPYTLRLVSEPPKYGRRSLALPDGGRRSLFNSQGLVETTERLERFILWPSGIRSPGAMRQWGNHATVFVGRRHFDDPFLFEEGFSVSKEASN